MATDGPLPLEQPMVEVRSGFIKEVRFNKGQWFQVPRNWTMRWDEGHRQEQPLDQATETHEISVAIREATDAVREAKEATRSHELAMIQAISHLVEAVRDLTCTIQDLTKNLP